MDAVVKPSSDGTGDEIAKAVNEIIAMPPSVVARYNAVTQPMD